MTAYERFCITVRTRGCLYLTADSPTYAVWRLRLVRAFALCGEVFPWSKTKRRALAVTSCNVARRSSETAYWIEPQ